MISSFKTLPDLLDHFKDEETCRLYLEHQRWGDKVCCIHCGFHKVYRTNRGYKCANSACYKKFSVKVGTIYQDSKIPLRIWFAAVYMALSGKKGVSSPDLSRELGITIKTAWFVLHRIREMVRDKKPTILQGIVEIDETYVGGKNKNRHKDKKTAYRKSAGRAVIDKTPVIGLVERGGKLITIVTPDVSSGTIYDIATRCIKENSTIVTDSYVAYNELHELYRRIKVKHTAGAYYVVQEIYHTQHIENFWSILKRGIIGVYHYVSRKHLQRYCDEFTFRYNTRHLTNTERFDLAMENCECRLTYSTLILRNAA